MAGQVALGASFADMILYVATERVSDIAKRPRIRPMRSSDGTVLA